MAEKQRQIELVQKPLMPKGVEHMGWLAAGLAS